MALQYPNARRSDTVETLHGVEVRDPYRWMEEDSEELTAWIKSQNEISNAYLTTCDLRSQVRKRAKELYDYPKYSCPFRRGKRMCFFKNSGLQNQSVLYAEDAPGATPRVLLDPNKLAEDGTAALSSTKFTENGELLAYAVSRSGSDWQSIYVRRVDSAEDTGDCCEWAKFTSLAWLPDNSGFVYARFPAPSQTSDAGTENASNRNHALYFHRIGTKQSEDVLLFADPDHPEYIFGSEITEDGKYLIISASESCAPANTVHVVDLGKQKEIRARNDRGSERGALSSLATEVVGDFRGEYDFVTNEGSKFLFLTNYEAPKRKVVMIDIADKTMASRDVIPESDAVLEHVSPVHGTYLAVVLARDAQEELFLYRDDGSRVSKIELPTKGSIVELQGRKRDAEMYFKFASFVHPGTAFRYDVESRKSSVYREPELRNHNPDDYETLQEFFVSRDGTRVPAFIVRRKGCTGPQPALLYGYGGFNISLTPSFSPFRLVLIGHLGCSLVVANLRGGGEYGVDWWKQGIKEKKQNVFDDFQAAADFLVEKKYASRDRLAIMGGSNGGLLVGACITQRPDLCAAAVAQVGVMDMLRFHKFTIGHHWRSDFGDPDDPKDFEAIIKYSPLHNVRAGKPYPAVLLTTADHDDRVAPLHSFKFAAEVQHVVGSSSVQEKPLLIRIEEKAGHGAGKPTEKVIDEVADTYGFLAKELRLTWQE